MPYDSNGNFTLDAGYLAVTGQTILPSQHNPPLEDLALNGLSNAVVRDGRAPMTGPLNMGGQKINNLAAGTLSSDAVNLGQVAWQQVGIYSLASAATLNVTNLSAFRKLRVSGSFTTSASSGVALRTSSNNGASYDSGATDYTTQSMNASGTSINAGNTSSTQISISSGMTNDGSFQFAFELMLENFNSSGSVCRGFGRAQLISGSVFYLAQFGCVRSSNTGRNAIQIFPGSGGTISGLVVVEGVPG